MYDSFEEWMEDVDLCIAGFISATSDDIKSCNYVGMYKDGYRPSEAAEAAIENAFPS